MKRRSLRFQLTAWYTAAMALTMALAGAAVWWSVRQSILETVDKGLRSGLFAAKRLAKETGSDSLPEELGEQASSAGTQYRLADSQGHWRYRSPGTADWPTPAALPAAATFETIRANGHRFRLLSAPVGTGILQVAAPLEEFDEMLDQFTWTAALLLPVMLLMASAGGYWMSGRALLPMEQITRTAEDISARNLSRRLPTDGPGDELDRLSTTLNRMFARLEEAFLRMSRFTADASHELRTPVAIIRTTAELSLSKPRGVAEYVGALERVQRESERTTGLLDNLMTLARGDSDDGGIELQALDLASLVRETCSEVRVLADASRLRMETALPESCWIAGDSAALRRPLLILLDNAIKYTPAGGRIAVSLVQEHGHATLSVEDTGIGIGPDDLPHIFERFYRASTDRSRSTGGVGLGLSIARWIITRHAGEISVESTPGKGSVFHVRFPLRAGDTPADPLSSVFQKTGAS